LEVEGKSSIARPLDVTVDVLARYPAGACLRVGDICKRPPKPAREAKGRMHAKPAQPAQPGLLPIVPRTWLQWVQDGKVPQGKKVGKTRVWRIEDVLAVAS
jgi:hypothetical protein